MRNTRKRGGGFHVYPLHDNKFQKTRARKRRLAKVRYPRQLWRAEQFYYGVEGDFTSSVDYKHFARWTMDQYKLSQLAGAMTAMSRLSRELPEYDFPKPDHTFFRRHRALGV